MVRYCIQLFYGKSVTAPSDDDGDEDEDDDDGDDDEEMMMAMKVVRQLGICEATLYMAHICPTYAP